MSRHAYVRAGVATVATICSSINVWHWQHRPRTVGALNGTRVPKQFKLQRGLVSVAMEFSRGHNRSIAASPHGAPATVDLGLAERTLGCGLVVPDTTLKGTPSAHATPLHFVRLFYPLSLSLVHVHQSYCLPPASFSPFVCKCTSLELCPISATHRSVLFVHVYVCVHMCVCVCMYVCV